MGADDRKRVSPWAATSGKELDRLALQVLRAAREAERELRCRPPDEARRMWAMGKLAGQIQAMLGPELPGQPPTDVARQEGLVRTALALAVHIRSHHWAATDLGLIPVSDRTDPRHLGERQAAEAFDIVGRLTLPYASPEGWAATLATEAARGDKGLEAAVTLAKYALHPTFLGVMDDLTRELGAALHSLNISRLHRLTEELRESVGIGTPGSFDGITTTESPGDIATPKTTGVNRRPPRPGRPDAQGLHGL